MSARQASGLDLMASALDYAGLDVTELGPDSLVYELHDGTAFVVTGHERNRYAVERHDIHAPEGTPPTHRDDELNVAEVVRVLTFARTLPPTRPELAPEPTTARKRWLSRRS